MPVPSFAILERFSGEWSPDISGDFESKFQDDLVNKMCINPRKIFNLPEQPNTYIEVNLDDTWTIPKETAYSKAKWTPFAGSSCFQFLIVLLIKLAEHLDLEQLKLGHHEKSPFEERPIRKSPPFGKS